MSIAKNGSVPRYFDVGYESSYRKLKAKVSAMRKNTLTIITPGITFKKPVELPQWKLDAILNLVHMDEKRKDVDYCRMTAVFKKPVHVCPEDLNPKTERCNMPGHPFVHTKFCQENDTRPICCKAFRDGECRDKSSCRLFGEIKTPAVLPEVKK